MFHNEDFEFGTFYHKFRHENILDDPVWRRKIFN